MLALLRAVFANRDAGGYDSGRWEGSWRVRGPMPRAVATLQQLSRCGEFARWTVRDSHTENGTELILQLFRRETYNTRLEAWSFLDVLADNHLNAQGRLNRAMVVYEFDLSLRLVAAADGSVKLTAAAVEQIDSRRQAFNHQGYRCASRLWEVEEFSASLASALARG